MRGSFSCLRIWVIVGIGVLVIFFVAPISSDGVCFYSQGSGFPGSGEEDNWILNADGDSYRVDLVGRWTSGPCYSSAVRSDTVYVLDGSQLEVLDCSVPSSPVILGEVSLISHGEGVALSEGCAYIAAGDAGLLVVDITDPANPQEVGSYYTDGETYGVAVSGSHVYLADGSAGLRVIDISDPSNPTEVGSYDTNGYAWSVVVSGNYAYVADGLDGLYILDCTQATPVMLQAFSASALSDGVHLTWEVAEETDVASYRLYRSSTEGERGTPLCLHRGRWPEELRVCGRGCRGWREVLVYIECSG